MRALIVAAALVVTSPSVSAAQSWRLATVSDTFIFDEGPARFDGALIVSDVRADRMVRVEADGRAEPFREPSEFANGEVAKAFHGRFPGAVIANSGFDRDRADGFFETGLAAFVSFGRPFIANPDLPARYAAGAHLSEPDPATFYGEGPEGYVDYPTMLEAAAKTRDDAGELLEPAR